MLWIMMDWNCVTKRKIKYYSFKLDGPKRGNVDDSTVTNVFNYAGHVVKPQEQLTIVSGCLVLFSLFLLETIVSRWSSSHKASSLVSKF